MAFIIRPKRLATQPTEHEMKFKLVLLGMSSVGKSALTLRHVNNTFNSQMSGTLGVSFLRNKLSIGEHTAITESTHIYGFIPSFFHF